MHTQEVTWLRKRFRQVSSGSPSEKRVKFQTIHQSLVTQFPSSKFSSKVISDIVNSAFPESTRVSVGKSKVVHVVGIEEVMDEEQQPDEIDDLQRQKAINAQLVERIQQLEEHVQHLEARIRQLEQEHHQYSPRNLKAQMGALTVPSHLTYHGPDTVGHFDAFSNDNIIAEFRQHCPDILALLQCVGNLSEDDDHSKQAQITTCLSILMKCYSRKVLGVQLMTSFMLLARATSKQVHVNRCMILRILLYMHTAICSCQHTSEIGRVDKHCVITIMQAGPLDKSSLTWRNTI